MVSKRDELYYRQALRYLREQGKMFAERHPDEARLLGLSGNDAALRDPHAERIVEAFAFLTGKLNSFMDAQFPRFTQSLFGFIYPHYPRPLPARTIASFQAAESMIDKPVLIPRGTRTYAADLGPDGRRYTFTTCWDLYVQPLILSKVYHDPEAPGDFSLSVVFRAHGGTNLASVDWDHFELMLTGEPTVVGELFYQFSENLVSIGIKGMPTHQETLTLTFPGFNDDHDYWENEGARHSGLHFPRDYFHDPARFFCLSVNGLAGYLQSRDDLTGLQLDFTFSKPMATGVHPNHENIRLGCCVAQNLYEDSCEPFLVDDERLEYQLDGDAARADLEVVDLTAVVASKDGEAQEVRPFYRFSNDHLDQERHLFYALRRDEDADQGQLLQIRFLDSEHKGPGALAGYTISARARFSNRHFAQKLKRGQLNEVDTEIPETISVTNLTLPSPAVWPSLGGEEAWDFLAHLSLDYSELHQEHVLTTLLTLYNYGRDEGGMRRIRGIREVKGERDYQIVRGATIAGRRLEISVETRNFSGLGDVALFTRVIGHFLQSWCPINGFLRLIVREDTAKTCFEHVVWG